MITGDNERTAKAISSKLDIDREIAQVLPNQKEETISKLKTEGDKVVAMVGNGIKDTPALFRADLGIGIGSGTNVVKETGGIILIKDDIQDVITALDLGKKTVSKIKHDLFGLLLIHRVDTNSWWCIGSFSWNKGIWMASDNCRNSNGLELCNRRYKFVIAWKI